ncbi:MAG: DUF6152 family protein [Acidobacteriota bacterium]
MKPKFSALLAVAAFAIALPVAAHHSFAAEYDAKAQVEIDGTVTKVEWTNPHAHFYIDVMGPDGKMVNWNFEVGSPNLLSRNGWTRKSIQAGDKVHVVGSRAKDGTPTASASLMKLPSGQAFTLTGAQQGKK